jgi:PTH1 family peptidyl-tRNA hydrolase
MMASWWLKVRRKVAALAVSESMAGKYLVVGLGNPGREYRNNRHNIGFLVIDHLAARHGLLFGRAQSGALVASGSIMGSPVILAKPQSFMNRSGGPVSSLLKFYRIPLDQMLVAYDELDLPPGTLRLRAEGGAGGHNGMKDIIQRVGAQNFARLRIGIGRPPGKMDPAAYVLQDFSREEQEALPGLVDRAAGAIETWLADGITLAMSRHNTPAEKG